MNKEPKKTRVIKRYQNRKLYDTVDSCYVTLEDIRDLLKAGEEIRVIDNARKEDLTSVTFAQIIFEEEKKTKGVLPLTMFKEIITTGGEALRSIVQTGIQEIGHVRSFVDKQIKPTLETVQNFSTVTQEIKHLKAKIALLERKLKEWEESSKLKPPV